MTAPCYAAPVTSQGDIDEAVRGAGAVTALDLSSRLSSTPLPGVHCEGYDRLTMLAAHGAGELRVQLAVPSGHEADARRVMGALEGEFRRGRLKREED